MTRLLYQPIAECEKTVRSSLWLVRCLISPKWGWDTPATELGSLTGKQVNSLRSSKRTTAFDDWLGAKACQILLDGSHNAEFTNGNSEWR